MITLTGLELNATPVARWGYEKAFATQHLFKCDRTSHTDELEAWLNSKFGKHTDNKVTFEMRTFGWTDANPPHFYLTFHDGHMYLGLGIRPYRGDTLSEPDKLIE